ncbi:MAG: sigma-70 family RNA polymerase sigma factor, partial [Ignavibacteriaceae bacterium]|nr:sigma-70 family RNA polymerase sigma factor [Ignavibacteriaceae bacterium]
RDEMSEFETLVKTNMKRAYYSALGLTGSHDVAMELSQEAFLRAYKHFKKYDRTKNFFTWYYKILRNLCLNLIRDNKRKKEKVFTARDSGKFCTESLFESIENKELQQNIEEALNSLEPEDRELIVLREFDGMSYKEIAELLHLPAGTVMSRLYYTRKKLAAALTRRMV